MLFVLALQQSAQAVQWQPLSGTSRYKVAYDGQSVRLTPLGRLEIWLRFLPRGDSERKSAAAEYKEKRYRSHLEYYEIDCSEQTALLGLVDLLGSSGVRLKRLQGSASTEPILPGSVLDGAARSICPVLDEDIEEVDDEQEPSAEPGKTADSGLSEEKLIQIEKLRQKANSKDANAETWRELGNIYFDTDQPELAIKAYARSLELKPDDPDTLNDQGAMYRQTGDFQRALANFEKAFSIDPKNLESLYNRSFVYAFDLNDIPKALVLWKQYIGIESKSEVASQIQTFIEKYER